MRLKVSTVGPREDVRAGEVSFPSTPDDSASCFIAGTAVEAAVVVPSSDIAEKETCDEVIHVSLKLNKRRSCVYQTTKKELSSAMK